MSKSSFFTNSGSAQTTQLAFAEANDSILTALSRAETAASTAESSAATLSGSAATVTGLINGFSADLSAAENANATAIAQQATLTTAQAQLTSDLGTIDTKIADATKLANNPLEAGFTLSTDPTDAEDRFSALHYATKAETAQSSAETAKGDAETAQSEAETARTEAVTAKSDAEKLAITALNSPITLSDGTTGFSALHYSSLAGNAKDDASKLAVHPVGSTYTLADGTTTGYSALHYQDLAQKFAVNATSFDVGGTTYQSALSSAGQAEAFADSDDVFTVGSVEHVSAKTWAQGTDFVIGETTYKSAKQYADAASAVEDRLDDFALVYQGAHASQPTARTDGTALQADDLYFDTTGNTLLIYQNSAWVGVFDHPSVIKRSYIFEHSSQTGVTNTISGTDVSGATLYIGATDIVEVYIQGQKQREDDFTVNRVNNSITITGELTDGNHDIIVSVYNTFTVTDAMLRTGGAFSGPVTFNGAATHTAGEIFNFSDLTGHTIEHQMITMSTNSTPHGTFGVQKIWDSTNTRFLPSVFVEARDGATRTAGLSFEGDKILPRYAASADSQVRVNLGASTHKFKSGHFEGLTSEDVTAESITVESTSDLKVAFSNGTTSLGEIEVKSNGEMHINEDLSGPLFLNGRRIGFEAMSLIQVSGNSNNIKTIVPPGNCGFISVSSSVSGYYAILNYQTPGQLNVISEGSNVRSHAATTDNVGTAPDHSDGAFDFLNIFYRKPDTSEPAKLYFSYRGSGDLPIVVSFH